jgi:hypothetical protein
MPSRVSQHQAGPGPSRPVAAYPARRQRAVIAGSRASSVRSAAASRLLPDAEDCDEGGVGDSDVGVL